MPTAPLRNARLARRASASVVASASAMLGPSSGAMTIAPMTTATLFRARPMAATTVDRPIITR
jgi:hypothetical protein